MFNCLKNIFSSSNYIKTESNNLIILLPKNSKPNSTLIFLHGIGDSGEGYLQTFDSPNKPVPQNMKVILPTAPLSYVNINKIELNSWFDIKGFTKEEDINLNDIKKNSESFYKLIEEEAKQYNNEYKKIFLGGFSQGACLSLNIGLNFEKNIGGLIIFSGILFQSLTKNVKNKENLPIYIGHGINDLVINFNLAKYSYNYFIENKYKNVNFNEFNIEHCICPQELIDMKTFLENLINS